MPQNQSRIKEIERIFHLLGLDSQSDRQRMLDLSDEANNEPTYHVYSTGDTRTNKENQYAELE